MASIHVHFSSSEFNASVLCDRISNAHAAHGIAKCLIVLTCCTLLRVHAARFGSVHCRPSVCVCAVASLVGDWCRKCGQRRWAAQPPHRIAHAQCMHTGPFASTLHSLIHTHTHTPPPPPPPSSLVMPLLSHLTSERALYYSLLLFWLVATTLCTHVQLQILHTATSGIGQNDTHQVSVTHMRAVASSMHACMLRHGHEIRVKRRR